LWSLAVAVEVVEAYAILSPVVVVAPVVYYLAQLK
jgi:hypothetical protein